MTSPAIVREERVGLGIATMLAGVFALATMDAMAKWLAASYSVAQVVFFRSLFAIPLILLLAHASGGLRLLVKTKHPWVHLARGLVAAVATFAFFTSLRYMPLAEAWAIAFAAPLIVTALSWPLLGERVGWRRWAAVLVGFLGVLVVVRPGMATFQPAALLALVTAMGYGLILITARKYAPSESTPTLVFYTTVVPLVAAAAFLPAQWQTPEAFDWVLFAGMGLLGGAAMLLLTQAFRLAPAAIVAPFDYTALIWSVGWGWLIWNELPDAYGWVGAALVVTAGLYVVHRETRLARRPRVHSEAR